MKKITFPNQRPKKECCECGAEIKEKRESIVYECEHCMTQKSE